MMNFKVAIYGMDITPVHAYSVSAKNAVSIMIKNGLPEIERENFTQLLSTFYREEMMEIRFPNMYVTARVTRIN